MTSETGKAQIYNRALSDKEIQLMYSERAGRLKSILSSAELIEFQTKFFLAKGSDYHGPIVADFARQTRWLTREIMEYFDHGKEDADDIPNP